MLFREKQHRSFGLYYVILVYLAIYDKKSPVTSIARFKAMVYHLVMEGKICIGFTVKYIQFEIVRQRY